MLHKCVVLEEEMAERVECEICLVECQEEQLEEHREMCMARLMFRCAICAVDYLSKEGLWNHLHLHEIADDSKELYYQEIRATNKLHQCDLCNDHRGYQEDLFWKHIHEKHDGFFLRCLQCGESFQSYKLKVDHDLTHSKAREQTVTGIQEADQELSSIVLPVPIVNTASLVCYGKINVNAAITLEPSQGDLSNVLREDSKTSEIKIVDQQVNDSRLGEIVPTYLNNSDDANNNMYENDSEVLHITSSKSMSESNIDAEKLLQPLVENPFDTKCSHCGKKFSHYVFLTRHIDMHHKPHMCDICGITFVTYFEARYHKIMRHKGVKHKGIKHKCPHCSKLFPRKKDQSIHSWKCKNKRFSCEICHQKFKDSKNVVVHLKRFHPNNGSSKKIQINSISCNEKKELCQAEKITINKDVIVEEKTLITENILQSHMQDSSSASSDTKCIHCEKEFISVRSLTYHIVCCHKPTTCNICGKLFPGMDSTRYHKKKYHMEPKYNCPYCPKKFQHKENFQVHLSFCMSRKFSCELCDKKFKNLSCLNGHKRRVHHSNVDLSNIQDDLTSCKNQQDQKQAEELTLKMEITVEDTKHLQHEEFGISTPITSTIPNCLDLRQITDVFDNFSGQNSALAQGRRTDTHEDNYSSITSNVDRIGCKVEHEQNPIEKVTVKKEISTEETTSTPLVITNCPIFAGNCVDENQVSRHVDKINQMTICISCGMTFSSDDQLNDHKLSCPLHQKYVISQFSSEKIAQPHGEILSSGLSDTVCLYCDKDCCYKALLARHIVWCHQPIVCDACGFTVSGKHGMAYHKKKYHSEPKFKCPHCSKISITKVSYLRHVSTHVKESKFSCKLCGRKYKSALNVKDHMKRTHGLKEYQTDGDDCNELEQEPQLCDDVNLIQGENLELKMEIKVEETTLHEQEYQVPDVDCTKSPTATIISASQLKARKLRMKSTFSCNKCHQIFHEIRAFQKHVNKHVHMEKNQFQCNICDRQLGSRRKLQSHMVREHKPVEIQCKCSICGVIVSSIEKLRYHKRMNHMKRRFKCADCPRKFFFEGVALAHRRTHKRNKSKHPNLLLAHIQHQHGRKSKVLGHENGIKIKEEPIEENTSFTPQSSTKPSQCHDVFRNKNVSDEAVGQREACSICGEIFENKRKMNYHKERFHTEPRFECPDCGKLYHVLYALRNHMTVHLKAKRKKMNENKDMMHENSTQNPDSSLQKVAPEHLDHENDIKIKDENQSYACKICELAFDNSRKLNYHELVIHTDPQHKCSHCPKIFHMMSVLRRHEVTHSKILEAEASQGCELCPLRFPDKCALQRHIAKVHPSSKISCDQCDLKFTTRYKLHYHVRKFHSEPGFKCPDCGKLYNLQFALRRHMAEHLTAKQKGIGESTNMSEQLDDALGQNESSGLQKVESERLDHDKEKEIKETESKPNYIGGLIIDSNMEHYKRTVHTEPTYKCSYCPKMLHTITMLDRHETTHRNNPERNVECTLCFKTFRGEYGLQRHISLSHSSSEFPCDKCELVFPTQSKLKNHVNLIHELRFKCLECDKPSHSQYALRKHMEVHSKIPLKKHSSDGSKLRRSEAKGEKTDSVDSTRRKSEAKGVKSP